MSEKLDINLNLNNNAKFVAFIIGAVVIFIGFVKLVNDLTK